MMKRLLVIVFFSLSLLALTTSVFAAKPRIRQPQKTAVTYSTAKLSRGTHSVIVTFLHLDRVSKITYTLSYTANGIEQGVVGSVTPQGTQTESRTLYFGTCSRGVCTPHYNISHAVLLIETTLSSGVVNTKRYKINI